MQDDHELSSLAFDAAPIGIVLTEHRIIRACNTTFCEFSGYDRQEILGQSFRIFYNSEDEFERIRDVGLKSLLDDGTYSDQRLLRRRDGSSLWCRFDARIMNADDPLARVVLSYARLTNGDTQRTLTSRERDVASLLDRGLTSREIGEDLQLSARTVEDVRARLLKKFNVKNASEMLTRLTNIEM